MAVLQLIVVFLVVILWALVLTFLPMLAISLIHCLRSVGFVGRGIVLMSLMNCIALMSRWLCRCARGHWHATQIALLAL